MIAATNRDLEAAIAAGRSGATYTTGSTFFRLRCLLCANEEKTFPCLSSTSSIVLLGRQERDFETVSKKSLDLLRSYPWPGNIRELQNVIERSVIVCESDNFSVDESWLSRRPSEIGRKQQFEYSKRLAAQEKEMIESVLRETKGRVFGPSGAAVKLGMPGTTLDSKIKSLKINKNRFKTS